jgi:hypothetical protein
VAYATMTAAGLRDAVRNITDLDQQDLGDDILNLYIRDGYYRILDLDKRWPFLEKSFTFNTVQNQRAYPIVNFTADPMSQIVSIVDPTAVGTRLDMVSYDEAEALYVGSYDTPGEPLFYALWEGNIHLFPKPNNARTLLARGYREPLDWVTSNGFVDASPNLHFPLVYYAASRVYQGLEDAQMADMYKRSYDEGVALARKQIQTPNSHSHLMLSAGYTKGRPTFNGWMNKLGRQLGQP